MQELITDCPRCFTKDQSFTVQSAIRTHSDETGVQHYEAYCMCGTCAKGTLFQLRQKEAGADILAVEGIVNIHVIATTTPPQYLPEAIETAFVEGQSDIIQSPDAAVASFMTCIDMATKGLMPVDVIRGESGEMASILSERLAIMFEQNMLPRGLKRLAGCLTTGGAETSDLLELTYLVLERIYTEPARLEIAQKQQGVAKEAVKIAG